MQDVSSATHFLLIYFPVLCNKNLPQLPNPCSLSTTFTGLFLCTLHSWSLIDNICHLTVPLPLPFSIPYCYLKYCFSIMLPASKALQSHSPLMRGTGTWIHTCSQPAGIIHMYHMPANLLASYLIQNLFKQNSVIGRSSQLPTTTLFCPQLHSSCHRSLGTEMLTASPHRILDSTLFTCISFFQNLA